MRIDLIERINAIGIEIKTLPLDERVEVLNTAKQILHNAGPFSNEPVDCVLWVHSELVGANDYNPNVVAPPEMKLLEHSIDSDHYTQPIVTCPENEHYEVIDGFHRNRIGKECEHIRERLYGYLPITMINPDRQERSDRISATIRHNRARGKHQVSGMSDIVLELARRNWSEKKIAKELGMEPDEVLRLKQVSGLTEMFADKEFSEAWEIE